MLMKKKVKKAAVHVWSPRDKRVYYVRNILLVIVIFGLGIFIGDGRINLSGSSQQSLNGNLPRQLDYSSVNKVYQALIDNYDGNLTQTQLLNGLKEGLAQSTNDPYNEYFTAKEAQSFNGELNNAFSGIGAELSETAQGELQVISPIDGSPAAKAGLKSKDIITEINGVTTTGMSVDAGVDKIRGKAGTTVTLQVLRGSQTLYFNIARENIDAPSVVTKILPGNIGYMSISSFADDTSSLSQKAAAQFKADNVKGIIVDLRDNPGGLVTAAVNVSSLWLKQGQEVMQEKRGTEVVGTEKALGGDVLNGIPTVVLINSGSASASEITAGALHDNGYAYLIGQKSFGKGVYQAVVCITGKENSNGTCPSDELKVTIGSWYRPDGQDIEHKGIIPDQTVPLTAQDITSGTDTQLNAAETYLNSK
jgi:carboxyl-terminal processing protease